MQQLLQVFVWLPLIGFIASLFVPAKKEKIIAGIAVSSVGAHLLLILAITGYWIFEGAAVLDIKHMVLYKTSGFEFFIDFYFDKITAVFAFIGSLIAFLVALFSRFYMHRDEGFKRFFATFLLFFLGYNLVIFGGNLETIFIGWETLGFCSFLLIAYYRDRWLPVKNGLKVISVYRLGDVCLMLAMWMCHHLFHQNIVFNQFNDPEFIASYLTGNTGMFIFIALMLLVAAAAKSALLPFSSWLPRAMEGPTTSSAVFYGSLSVHLGAFLLLRTYPLWEGIVFIKVLIIVLGLITSFVAASIARVQSTVKTQVAYASVTQIGLIFVEVALGWHTLALVHFAGNALLRTYQLLVSPSVLSYQVHDMFFNFRQRPAASGSSNFITRLQHAIYVLNVKEWNLDAGLQRLLWDPFKWTGKNLRFFVRRVSIFSLAAFFLFGVFSFAAEDNLHEDVSVVLPVIFSLVGLMLVLASFTERGDARRALLFVLGGQGFITLSIALNEAVPFHQLVMYLSTPIVATIAGLVCLNKISAIDNDILLNRYHGYAYTKPVLSFIFIVCCLASLGFPFTATFLGIDLLFTHLQKDQYMMVFFTALSFIFIELSLLRIYARIFLGPYKKNDHPIAFRAS